MALLQLSGIRRLESMYLQRVVEYASGGPGWSEDTCFCDKCVFC